MNANAPDGGMPPEVDPHDAIPPPPLQLTLFPSTASSSAAPVHAAPAQPLPPAVLAAIDGLRREAREAERAEQYALAVELLERAVAAAPSDFACLSHLASLYNQMGQLNRAMAIYGKIAPMRRGDSILLNNIASVYFDLGYIEKAIQFYQKAAEADAGNYLPHANLAYLGALLGDKELSGIHAAHLRRLSPHHRYQPFAKTAEFRALLLEGEKAQALALLERATVEDKQNLLFNLQRLLYARELGLEERKQEMISRNLLLAREALQKGYSPHKTYYRVTLFHLIGGHHAAAMQSARSAVHEGPYKGVLRFAGLFYLDELGVAPKDGVRKLWKEREEAIHLEESG